MKLKLRRIAKKGEYTIGRLYVDGQYFCDTLEDTDRGLTSKMSEEAIADVKVKGKTAIPTGRYDVKMKVVSPKYSNYARYPWVKPYCGCIPRLTGVKGFDGILIHVGNTAADTDGCILVGENKAVGKVLNSTATFHKLMWKLKAENDVVIDIC